MEFPDPGSICFVAVNADNAGDELGRTERFAFVAMVDIPPGTVLTFNNRFWDGLSYSNPQGSTITYRVPDQTVENPAGGLSAGQVVQISPTVGTGTAYASHGTIVSKTGYWDVVAGDHFHDSIFVNYAAPGATGPGPFLTAISFKFPGDPYERSWLDGTGLYTNYNAFYDNNTKRHFNTGTSIQLDPTKTFAEQDVFCVDEPTTEATLPHKEWQAHMYNADLNWRRDDGVNDGLPGENNDPEGNPLQDPNSPMYGKWFLPVPSASICFMPGTLIRTSAGEVAVEDLTIGDAVVTSDGSVQPVRWIGRQTVSTLFGNSIRVLPIRVQAGALAENVPARDLFVSPDHALLIDGVLVNAGALVNGTTIVRWLAPPATFTYYHVELHDHSLILAENTPAETFVDNVDRMAFDNWAEHEALYPDAQPVAEMTYPRAKSARQVPATVRARLEERAAQLGYAVAEAA